MKFTLRREQEALLDAIRTSLYSNRMVVASSPTGSGKTVMAAEIAHRHIGNGSDKHVWFVVDQIKLSPFSKLLSIDYTNAHKLV